MNEDKYNLYNIHDSSIIFTGYTCKNKKETGYEDKRKLCDA